MPPYTAPPTRPQETIFRGSIDQNVQRIEAHLEKAKRADEQGKNHRIAAGVLLVALRPRVEKLGKGWEAFCEEEFPERSLRDIRRLMKLAGAEDPEAADVAAKEERNKKDRERRERAAETLKDRTRVSDAADRIEAAAKAAARKVVIEDTPRPPATVPAAVVAQRVFAIMDPMSPDERRALLAMLVARYADEPTDTRGEPKPEPTQKGAGKGRQPGKDPSVVDRVETAEAA